MSARAAIVGSGTMGTALADVIASSGHACALWCASPQVADAIRQTGRHPRHFAERALARNLRATAALDDAVALADCVMVAVPSENFRATAARLHGLVAPGTPLLSATKGIEPDSGKCMSALLAEETGNDAVGAVAGANLAYDIIERRPTALVVAGAPGVTAVAARLLRSQQLHVQTTTDLRGVEWVGVLKNVVALAVGIAGGLGLGANARSAVFALGLRELGRLGSKLGAQPETLSGLATVADLFLTTTAESSRNHFSGLQLGRGMPLAQLVEELARMQETAEGLQSTRAARAAAVAQRVRAPLIEAVYQVVAESQSPASVFERLLKDPAFYEG